MQLWQSLQNITYSTYQGAKTVFSSATLSTLTASMYQTIIYLLEQVPAAMRAAGLITNNPRIQQVAVRVLDFTLRDVAPMVATAYLYDIAQGSFNSALHQEKNKSSSPYGQLMTVGLQSALIVLYAGKIIISTRQAIKLKTHSAILLMESTNAFNAANPTPPTICHEVHCSIPRVIQGKARDVVTYWLTNFVIDGISLIPVIGKQASMILGIQHNGRTILTFSLPELCERHQKKYLQEHQALALSLGIAHYINKALLIYFLESFAHLPSQYYASAINQLLLMAEIAITSQMSLPKAVDKTSKSNLPYLNMIQPMQNIMAFGFDTACIGLKKTIPRALNNPDASFPWERFFEKTGLIYHHPITHKLSIVLLPDLLHNTAQFINDPFVKPQWEMLRIGTIDAIKTLLDIKDKHYYKLYIAGTLSKKTAKLLYYTLGLPKPLTIHALNALNNNTIMLRLAQLALTLEGMGVSTLESLPNLDNITSATTTTLRTLPPTTTLPDPNPDMNLHTVICQKEIAPIASISTNTTIDTLQQHELTIGPSSSSAENMIKKSSVFFQPEKLSIMTPTSDITQPENLPNRVSNQSLFFLPPKNSDFSLLGATNNTGLSSSIFAANMIKKRSIFTQAQANDTSATQSINGNSQ